MKYHLQLLKKYISVDTTIEELAQNLIVKTCEIEEIETRELPKTVVIAKVESFVKHPDADKLNICQVNCGAHGKYQIVCGGENIESGIFVPVALVGTHLPAIDLTIGKRAVRGVESAGMICAKSELGIKEDLDQHWIWNLSLDLELADEDVGLALSDKFPWLDATVLEVDNKGLTNRPDLTGHFGAAVELNAIYDAAKKRYAKIKDYMQQFQNSNILDILEHSEKKLQRAVINETSGLNTYIALELHGVQVKESDFFTRLQLIDMAMNPVNNWVDFSNIFMNISGQPLHFFDADKVKGDLIIRDAKAGERFVDLFGTEHILQESDIVIADQSQVLALAGVIGGLESGITEQTKNIIVEIANFDPVRVRKTGTRLGLRTDAELRFEKNINPVFSLLALILFLDDLNYYAKSLGTYTIAGLNYALASHINPQSKKFVPAPFEQLEKLIFGVQMPEFISKAKKILEDLGFQVLENEVVVPHWRGPDDINIKEDIAEEIARIWGYDTIANQDILTPVKDQPMSQEVQITRTLEEMMVHQLHFDQIETYPRTSESLIKNFGGNPEELYALQNPLNPEFPYMRDKMLYNFISIAQKNSKFFDSFKLFDIGKVRNKTRALITTGLDPRYAEQHISEHLTLGALIYQKNNENWQTDTILSLKGIVEQIINQLGIKGKIFFEKSEFSCFHPKKQAKILLRNGAVPLELGYIATLHPLQLQNYKFPETAQLSFLELDLDFIKSLMFQQGYEKEYETLQDQLLRRDLSFVLENDADFGTVIAALEKMAAIEQVKVFDLYQGANLGEEKKSISLQLKIKGDGSMTTEAINTILQEAIKKGEQSGAKLRA